ncbi:formate dehydrogenase accessory protein FdhE [Pseudogemmobacter sonorensis]|uniref:formate dehydrogenase accessory protein FdhE n=1 Tax=Pseudogemmobacter sonorensis TaxID=2989681 RepID=UPI0036C91E0F
MSGAPVLRSSVPSEEATRHFDPVLRPDLAGLYATRAARLRELAQGHDLADYLRLAADVTEGQAASLARAWPVEAPAPVDPAALARFGDWPGILAGLLAHLRPRVPSPVLAHLDALAGLSEAELRQEALAQVEGRFAEAEPAYAPILRAALSVEVAQAARRAPLPASAGHETAECPLCGSAPVASLIHTGDRQGMRYLHCSLCECEWHMVRAKCSNCGDAGQLDYLSFDTPEAAIRAEACGACGSYLKVISQERAPEAEVVADDLASLLLDDAAVTEGFGRSGFNPFALPG